MAARTAELKASLDQLAASLANSQALTASAADAIITSDATQTILSWNAAAERIFGYTESEALGQGLSLIIPPHYRARHEFSMGRECSADRKGRAGKALELAGLTKAGLELPIELSVSSWNGTHGKMFAAIIRDITERKRSQEEIQLAASVFTFAREGIMITDPQGTILQVNESFSRITGYSREEAVGQSPRILRSGRQDPPFYAALWRGLIENAHWSGEIWNRHKDGTVFVELLTISAVKDNQGHTRQYVALFTDITLQKQHQHQLEHIAHHDALTDLPNRTLLSDRLQQAMVRAQRQGQKLAVVFIDLDGFKTINDRYGHEIGDRFLIALAARMKQALREVDTLARMGGDEFVAVLADLIDSASSLTMLDRLLTAASQAVEVDTLVLQISASIGATFYPQAQELDADQLLRQADQAMYQAKVAGKNRYHVFDAEQDSSIRVHHESVERIRLALQQNEFVLCYQPKVNMRSGKVIGAEALVRWQHPDRALLSPAT
ncbi:MAG: diguanylate cyclase, partial [Rhodoferax sp.]|nr:diguanylate cyclase [Rhodoferax sp.]